MKNIRVILEQGLNIPKDINTTRFSNSLFGYGSFNSRTSYQIQSEESKKQTPSEVYIVI